MQQQEIIDRLYHDHKTFVNFIDSLDEKDFNLSYDNKWTAGQQLDHIHRSVKPLTQALLIPKFLLKIMFSKSNRSSRTYEHLVTNYKAKLASGGRATGRFIPQPVRFKQREKLVKTLLNLIDKLARLIKTYTEEELDTHILPHPLLGKLTIREMMFFTIYHVAHHQELTKKNLAAKQV